MTIDNIHQRPQFRRDRIAAAFSAAAAALWKAQEFIECPIGSKTFDLQSFWDRANDRGWLRRISSGAAHAGASALPKSQAPTWTHQTLDEPNDADIKVVISTIETIADAV